MSRATFFKRFKDATAMSPLQYPKRLLEARRLMVEEGEGAATSALRVGYASARSSAASTPLRDTRARKPNASTPD